jgi:O-antigen/teichoic acid export membrane protein
MGIIQKQSVRSSIVILLGFALGGLNLVVFAPKILTAEQIGLTRIITEVAFTLATFCTLGSMPVVYKFFPFYKTYLPDSRNDLPLLTLIICIIGFILVCSVGYALQDVIVRKYSDRSPLFVEYSYLTYPLCLFMMLFMWLESFSWSLKKTVISNALKEVLPRVVFTINLVLFFFKIISLNTFLWALAIAYIPAVVALLIILLKTGEFKFVSSVSPVTRRLKGKMISFGLFVYGGSFLNLLSRTSDSFIITAKAANGLTDTAIFTIASYIATLMDIPHRSLTAISVPILAESWRNKDLKNIRHIYSRSISNLLVIGLGMFSLLWLNSHNIAAYMGKDFNGMESVILFLGIAKLIDLGTGANAQIIGTSNYWRVDFITNIIYTILALPLNYLLISRYGLLGAAYANLISQLLYNLMRYFFLWYKFKLQPYNLKHLLAIVIAVSATLLVYCIPVQFSYVLDAIIRTMAFTIIFVPLMYKSNISIELNTLAETWIKKLLKR